MAAALRDESRDQLASVQNPERRRTPRWATRGDLMLIDSLRLEVIRAYCLDWSRRGIRVRLAPDAALDVGHGVNICTRRSGQASPPGLPECIDRRATVVWVRPVSGAEPALEAGLQFVMVGADE